MILYTFVAIALAKVKGYKISPVLKAYSLYPYVFIEIIFLLLQISILFNNYSFIQYTFYIKTAYLYTLMIPMIIYKLYKPGLIGSSFILLGTFLNKFVMAQNGGKMPVYATLSKLTGYYSDSAILTADSVHVVGNELTKFKFLTDFIDLGWSVLSIGDLLIHTFAFIIVYYTIKEINTRQINKQPIQM